MSSPKRPRSSPDKLRAHRERLRSEGLRPIQIWVPDVRSPTFLVAAHRQSRAVAMSRFAKRDQAFTEAITLPLGDEAG